MTELQQNRYDQLIRRVGGIIGPGSKVSEVISELFPMFDVENLPGELFLLGGTRLGFGSALQPGIVGERSRIQLFNPADSGIIVTITTILFSVPNVAVVRLTSTINPESTSVASLVRDTRLGVTTTTVATVRAASEVAVLAANGGEFTVASNVLNQITDPNGIIVLGPGTGLTLTNTLGLSSLTVTFFWRERTAEQSELQF